MTTRLKQHNSERGAVGLAMTVFAVALIALVGLVYDGGVKVKALQRADVAAAEAARAAGQHITGADLLGGTGVDRAAAVAAAQNHLADAGVTGRVHISGDTITVTTATSEPTVFLSIIGITSVSATGQATVRITEGL